MGTAISAEMRTHQGRRPQRQQLEARVRDTILGAQLAPQTLYVDLDVAPDVDRQLLVERHLISKQHATSEGARRRGDRAGRNRLDHG